MAAATAGQPKAKLGYGWATATGPLGHASWQEPPPSTKWQKAGNWPKPKLAATAGATPQAVDPRPRAVSPSEAAAATSA